jgi:hypothetical protein
MRSIREGMGTQARTTTIGSSIGHAESLPHSRSQDQRTETKTLGFHAAEKEKHEGASEPCQSNGTNRRNPSTEKE